MKTMKVLAVAGLALLASACASKGDGADAAAGLNGYCSEYSLSSKQYC